MNTRRFPTIAPVASFVPALALVLALVGLVGVVLPGAAQARILLFDANFDQRTLLQGMDRRGAEFGEPIPGPEDTLNEQAWFDAIGDRSIRLTDTSASGADADLLYFGFSNMLQPSDGKLYLQCVVLPQEVDVYTVRVVDDSLVGTIVNLSFDGAGLLYWSDGDSPAVTQFLTYNAGQEYLVEIEIDLDNGTWDLVFDGLVVVQDESHGRLGDAVGAFVMGHQNDGNTTGDFRLDDVAVSWAPGSAPEYLNARFNNEPLGQPIGTGGALLGQPVEIDDSGLSAIVRGSITPTPSLELEDVSSDDDGFVRFELANGAQIAWGNLSVSFTLLFADWETWEFELQGLDLRLESTAAGNLILYDVSGGGEVEIMRHPYSIGGVFKMEFGFAFRPMLYNVWVANERIVHRAAIDLSVMGLSGLKIYLPEDSTIGERLRIDNVEVFHDGAVTSVTGPGTGEGDGGFGDVPGRRAELAVLHPATPNPFNPSTSLRFELARSADVELLVFDARGRQVRSLIVDRLGPGSHDVTWRGDDDGGGVVGSGVYHAVLRTPEGSASRRLVLVK